jgi:glycosyltransferase involved in cell wall biosynthesis
LRKLSVLHFGRFADPRAGGIPRHVSQLLNALAPRVRLANLVASTDRHSHAMRRDGHAVVEAACLGMASGTALAPAMLPLAHRLIGSLDVCIVHLHLPDPLSLLIAETLPRRIPVVATWHSDVVRQRAALALYQPLVERLTARMAAMVAATRSHFDTSTQLATLAQAKRRVIPYGIDAQAIDHPASRALGAALRGSLGPGPVVLGVGRHVYYKGFDVLIDAMPALPDTTLVLCGEGPLTAALRARAASRGVADRIVFAGRTTDEELAGWYQACDVFCMPSVEPAECFGLVQLEAMACGKPVVTTQLGNGVNEVHADGEVGFAVPVRDAAALSAALARLLSDATLRATMGEAGRARVAQLFAVERMRDATLALYEEVASGA